MFRRPGDYMGNAYLCPGYYDPDARGRRYWLDSLTDFDDALIRNSPATRINYHPIQPPPQHQDPFPAFSNDKRHTISGRRLKEWYKEAEKVNAALASMKKCVKDMDISDKSKEKLEKIIRNLAEPVERLKDEISHNMK